MNKANFPKIDKLLKYHEQKILGDEKKRLRHDRSSMQANRRSIENLEAYSHEKGGEGKKPTLNRKELLKQDLKRIQQGRH